MQQRVGRTSALPSRLGPHRSFASFASRRIRASITLRSSGTISVSLIRANRTLLSVIPCRASSRVNSRSFSLLATCLEIARSWTSRQSPFPLHIRPDARACGKPRALLLNRRLPHPAAARGMADHTVVIAGSGPTGMMLAGELALAGIDVAIVERRTSQEITGSRAGGLNASTIEVLDHRGIAERFISQVQPVQAVGFQMIKLDLSDFPTRHPHTLGLWQTHIERIMDEWIGGLKLPIYSGR